VERVADALALTASRNDAARSLIAALTAASAAAAALALHA
jgi:hypothetical protein